jgi:hypothetical protein
MRLHAYRIDALLRPLASRRFFQAFEHAFFLEIDRDRATGQAGFKGEPRVRRRREGLAKTVRVAPDRAAGRAIFA